jgi:hypothetical protein
MEAHLKYRPIFTDIKSENRYLPAYSMMTAMVDPTDGNAGRIFPVTIRFFHSLYRGKPKQGKLIGPQQKKGV